MKTVAFLVLLTIALDACAAGPATYTSALSPTQTDAPVANPSPTPIMPSPSPTFTLDTGTPSLALFNATLIDGTGTAPVPDAVVIIQEGHVRAVGERAHVGIPANAQAIDLQGATILPGLINAHVHDAYNARNLQAWAAAGVTTVRDLGARTTSPDGAARLYELRRTEFTQPQLAHIISASPMLTAPGGGYGALPITSSEDARVQVNRLLDVGADLVKISFEDNLIDRKWTPLPMEHAKATVMAAHGRGVPVSVHISRPHQVEWALEAGVDDLAHMVIDPLPDEILPRLIAQDVYWTPTMELWYGVGAGVRADGNLRRFAAAGGKVALGTDYAGYTIPFDLGLPIHELEFMQAAGMTPMQILVAATKHAAHVCNQDQQLGTLEVGKMADILVVSGDPLADIHALLNVRLVLHRGVIIRNELSR